MARSCRGVARLRRGVVLASCSCLSGMNRMRASMSTLMVLLAPLLKGLVVDTTPEQSEAYLRQTLLSRPNLEQVIVLANLGGASITSVQRQELVLNLATDFKVTSEGNNLISISYTNRNPVLAKNVVEALLSVFAERANSSSRAEMDHARAFLTSQIESYQTQLQGAEKRRADFKKKYAVYFNDEGVERPDTLRHEAEQANQQYQEALASRNAVAAQMRQIPQLLDVVSASPTVSSTGQIVVGSPEMRLSQAEHKDLSELKLLPLHGQTSGRSRGRAFRQRFAIRGDGFEGCGWKQRRQVPGSQPRLRRSAHEAGRRRSFHSGSQAAPGQGHP